MLTKPGFRNQLSQQQSASHGSSTCATATTHLGLFITNKGLPGGGSFLRPGARVDLINTDSRVHFITITPPALFNMHTRGNKIALFPGMTVTLRAAWTSQQVGGTIIDVQGTGRTFHDITICP